MPPKEPGTARLPLSRERVLRAAVRLADAHGIDSLTMRRLGEELHVEAMSLYKHVAHKNDLLDGMTDAVFGEIELPDRSTPTGGRRCATARSRRGPR